MRRLHSRTVKRAVNHSGHVLDDEMTVVSSTFAAYSTACCARATTSAPSCYGGPNLNEGIVSERGPVGASRTTIGWWGCR